MSAEQLLQKHRCECGECKRVAKHGGFCSAAQFLIILAQENDR
jgi:hypothetical protein